MNDVRGKLLNILDNEKIDLPDGITFEKVIERAEDITQLENTVSFTIERHPGLFGRSSRGREIGLSAFLKEKTRYSVNLCTGDWVVEVLKSNLEYDAWLLAVEEIISLKEGGTLPSMIENKDKIKPIIENALKLVSNYYYERWDENIRKSKYDEMVNALLDEMRKQLIKEYS